MEVIGFTYETDYWCPHCLENENVDLHGPDVGVMFDYTEVDYPPHCCKCNEVLGGELTEYGRQTLKEEFLAGYIELSWLQTLMDIYAIDWVFLWTFAGWVEGEE